jgi:hypothetical protein
MAYSLPTFNLAINIWRNGNRPPGPLPDVTTTGNLAAGRRSAPLIVYVGISPPLPIVNQQVVQLLLPALTDVQDVDSAAGPDWIEVPAGTGNFYQVARVYDAGRGFANEHRVALISRVAPVPTPYN